MKPCRMTTIVMLFVGLFVLAASDASGTDATRPCFITGHISGEMNLEAPELGFWRYTLSVTWDTGGKLALSHFNLSFGESSECSCEDFETGLNWQEFLGWSTGLEPGEETGYRSLLECDGDPSMGLRDPLLKLEPDQTSYKGPGVIGRGEVVFYSDYAPWRIKTENRFMSMKFGQESCYGPLTGMFPALPCDPTPETPKTWATIKQYYR